MRPAARASRAEKRDGSCQERLSNRAARAICVWEVEGASGSISGAFEKLGAK